MVDSFTKLDIHIQTLLVSIFTSIIVSMIPLIFNWWKDKYMLKFKLRREYAFKQRWCIKEKLANSKTPLLKAAEELNFRLWNLSENIEKKWHIHTNSELKTHGKCYYIKSFVYRFLTFMYWIEKVENDIYNFDFSAAAKEEKKYLKYIKVLKYFFSDRKLLEDIGYTTDDEKAHFYNDHIKIYTDYIKTNESSIQTYGSFVEKFETDFSTIEPIVKYISNIRNEDNNYQYNVLKSFHLFLILFLNEYGLDYHYTNKKTFKKLINEKYHNIAIKSSLMKFFIRNKAYKEADWIINGLKLDPWHCYRLQLLFSK